MPSFDPVMETLRLKNHYYLLRHGESEANRSGIIVSRPEVGISQFGLTGVGVEQVTTCAFNTRLGPNTVIVSSDFRRTLETAEIFNKVISCNKPVETAIELRERHFGDWDGSDVNNYQTVWSRDLDPSNDGANGVESVNDVLQRFLTLIMKLETQHQNQQILLVSHGDVLQIGLTHFKGLDARQHRSQVPVRTAELRALPRTIGETTTFIRPISFSGAPIAVSLDS